MTHGSRVSGAVLLFLLAMAAAFACGRSKPQPSTGSAGAGAQGTTAPSAAAAEELPMPPEGRVEVSVGMDGILALANQAPRRRVLEALARETDLVVVAFVEGGEPEGRVTFRSRGEPIEVVLARALVGVPFSVAPLEGGPKERLAVVVGWQDEKKHAARVQPESHSAPGPAAPPESPEPAQPDEKQALEQLASSDPAERAEAVEATDVTSPAGFEAVVERLANDPDPTVREAAAESLADGDVGGVRPLLDALSDSDSRVVLAALESLELLADASVIPQLAPALQHPDAAVRERAAEVAEFLE